MSKERILLINPGCRSRRVVYFPLGLSYVAGACHKEGKVGFFGKDIAKGLGFLAGLGLGQL